MTTLEKMARARCQRLQEQYKGYPFANLIAWENRSESERQELIECERAALEALREPSEGMIAAAYEAFKDCPIDGGGHCIEKAMWQAAIDHILEEKD